MVAFMPALKYQRRRARLSRALRLSHEYTIENLLLTKINLKLLWWTDHWGTSGQSTVVS